MDAHFSFRIFSTEAHEVSVASRSLLFHKECHGTHGHKSTNVIVAILAADHIAVSEVGNESTNTLWLRAGGSS